MSRGQQDNQELLYQQRGPLTVPGPLTSMHEITSMTLNSPK